MTTKEITSLALERGLVNPRGKTPEATMAAALYRHAQKASDLQKLASAGSRRAKRGTVRWAAI